jgi:hypothetical protein
MKLKCSHGKRALVLPSGNTVHRVDGSRCFGILSIGGDKVTKLYAPDTRNFVTLGSERNKVI